MLLIEKKVQLTKDGNLKLSLGHELGNQWVSIKILSSTESESKKMKLSDFVSKWEGTIGNSPAVIDSKLDYLLKKHT